MDRFLVGYLMGLIVGEGSFSGDRKNACLAVKLHEEDPLPLVALQKAFGGKLNGPYRYTQPDGVERRSMVWQLRGKRLFPLLPLIHKHLPQSRKREQFEVWLVKYRLSRIVAGQLTLWNAENPRKVKIKRPVTAIQLHLEPATTRP